MSETARGLDEFEAVFLIRWERDRDLRGAIAAVVDLARQVALTPRRPPQKQRRRPAEAIRPIVERVCAAWEIPQARVISADRSHWASEARHVLMYVLRRTTDLSLPEIGRAMGGMDHSTVTHGIRRTTERMKQDELFARRVAALLTDDAAPAALNKGA